MRIKRETQATGLEVLFLLYQTPNTLKIELWAEVCTKTDFLIREKKRFTSVKPRGERDMSWFQLEIPQYCRKEG